MAEDRAPDEGAPNPELLEAIEVAARHVGLDPDPDPDASTPVVVRFEAPRLSRVRLWLLMGLLVVSAVGSGYLWFRPQPGPPPAAVEADLRWAVAQVVRRVETLRRQTGHLPEPGDLGGLVSDLVVYEPLGEGYWVYGQRGPVRVEFDGTVPLARWERLHLYGSDAAPP